jgi:hypothetical protein
MLIMLLVVSFYYLLGLTRALINPLGDGAKGIKGPENNQDQKDNLASLVEKNVNTNHRLENLDRQLSTTSVNVFQVSKTIATNGKTTENSMPAFYTRSDGYLIRYMNKAAPTSSPIEKSKAPVPNNNNKVDQTPNQPEDKPIRPTQPAEPPRPTVTMGRPANSNNNNPQPPAAPTRTSAGSGGKAPRTASARATKKTGDDDDDGEDDDGDQPKKTKKPASPTQPAQGPAKTTDQWGGDLLPTRSSKPRWMRNDGGKIFANLVLSVISMAALLVSII